MTSPQTHLPPTSLCSFLNSSFSSKQHLYVHYARAKVSITPFGEFPPYVDLAEKMAEARAERDGVMPRWDRMHPSFLPSFPTDIHTCLPEACY